MREPRGVGAIVDVSARLEPTQRRRRGAANAWGSAWGSAPARCAAPADGRRSARARRSSGHQAAAIPAAAAVSIKGARACRAAAARGRAHHRGARVGERVEWDAHLRVEAARIQMVGTVGGSRGRVEWDAHLRVEAARIQMVGTVGGSRGRRRCRRRGRIAERRRCAGGQTERGR